jgi:uncharacterized repeat protein (TIGR03803 family)
MTNMDGRKWAIGFVFFAAPLIASGAQTFATLHSFAGYPTDGAYPSLVSLVQGTDGNLYGTTFEGGSGASCPNGCGTIFTITPTGELTTLYSFCAQPNCTDGSYPSVGLIQSTTGDFLGITEEGGAYNYGSVFKLSPTGKLTTLYSFCSQANCADGVFPEGVLLQAANGRFYGTTYAGGNASNCGTVFEMTTAGKLTTLYDFCSQTGCADGCVSVAGLTQAPDGNFLGTNLFGGSMNSGTVFKMTPAGKLITLHTFCSQTGCSDGKYPYAGLIQATSGRFYGTTYAGGTSDQQPCAFEGCGTVYEITAEGKLTTLYSFCSETNCSDGSLPQAGLVQATNGNFYGTASQDGAYCTGCYGTSFEMTPAGELTTLTAFGAICLYANCPDGRYPTGLVQATNGNFYGITGAGGADNYGTVFRFSAGLGPFVKTLPDSGKVGAEVGILGTNLTGATRVTFNGTPSRFSVSSPSLIFARVPTGATTGMIEVTLLEQTLSSNVPFYVLP